MVTGVYKGLQSTTVQWVIVSYKRLQPVSRVTRADTRFPGVTRGYKGSEGVKKDYKGLQEVTQSYKKLQEVRWDDRELQRLTKDY